MPSNNPPIIADAQPSGSARRVWLGVLAGAIVVGGVAAWYVASQGLTLSHYDARGHLVVSRRVADSLTPGWRQFGAVWLPLPHLVNFIPSQLDWAYRTGAIAVLLSIGFLATGLAALAHRLFARTGSVAAAITPAALMLANPNVLYLQSTPMTEPTLIGLALLSLAAVDEWIHAPSPAGRSRAAWLIAALMMTRYEGWLIAAGLAGIATIAAWRRGPREWEPLWLPSAIVVAAFLVLGYAATGQWFLSASFFVPENPALHRPLVAAEQVFEGLKTLASPVVIAVAGAGAIVAIVRARWALPSLLPLALLFSAALPIVAFSAGHPFRVRYMVPLVAACAVLGGVAVAALPRRLRAAAAGVLFAAVVWTRPPWDMSAPMVTEAQWETPFRLARQSVTRVLGEVHDGQPILASMGSLAHYMHETSAIGLNLRDFLHEGNGDLWAEALRDPRASVRWILIEERAEGGDMLAAIARSTPGFLGGFERVAEGGGLVLYRRK